MTFVCCTCNGQGQYDVWMNSADGGAFQRYAAQCLMCAGNGSVQLSAFPPPGPPAERAAPTRRNKRRCAVYDLPLGSSATAAPAITHRNKRLRQ